MTSRELVENFFRHEYGKLVSVLSGRFGLQHVEAIEDAVQFALMRALEGGTASGPPNDPSAWVYRVAYNELLGQFRKGSGHRRILERNYEQFRGEPEDPGGALSDDILDDMLRMLFVCCDASIPRNSQIVLALKILCGFEVSEIGFRLFSSDANIYKRLARARKQIKTSTFAFDDLDQETLSIRLDAVHAVIYQIFSEGYLSSRADLPIRRELCLEAIRLATILADHPIGQESTTYALLALMYCHLSRMTARQDGAGGLFLLEEQNRSLFDNEAKQTGLSWLEKSASGDKFSRYHAEAGIAAEHCLAPSFEETRWDRVVDCYTLLEAIVPSPIHTLNRAVAVAELDGPGKALAILQKLEPPVWLTRSYLWAAVLADLNNRCGNLQAAFQYREAALRAAPGEAVVQLLKRRLSWENQSGASDK